MSPPERMRHKLGDLATVIADTPSFGDSATMPLDSTNVEDHLTRAANEALAEMKVIAETLLRSGNREGAVKLQSARLTLKMIAESYVQLRDKDALERRHCQRAE